MKKDLIKNKIIFVRYGDLSPITHEKYIKNSFPNRRLETMEESSYSFHTPPAKRGIYAFVYPYVEKYLLSASKYSGIKSTHPKVEYVKDEKGNKILKYYPRKDGVWFPSPEQETFIQEKILTKQGELPKDYLWEFYGEEHMILCKRKKPKYFEYSGEIWHHLRDHLHSPRCILEEKGGWVKTDFLSYKIALKSALGQIKKERLSRDHLEVFIERVK